MIKFLIVLRTLLFAALFPLYSFSKEVEPIARLSNAQAVQLALSNNMQLLAARKVVEQIDGQRAMSGIRENAEVSFSYSTDTLFNDEGEQSLGVAFEQKFPITNRLRFEREIAKSAVDLAVVEIHNQERVLIENVERLVVEAEFLQSQLELRDQLIDLDVRFAAFIASQIETGEASAVEANQVKIALYALQQEKQALENEKLAILAELQKAIGAEVVDSLEVEYTLDLSESSEALPTFSEEMLRRHPEYRLKALMADIAKNRVALAHSKKWEDIAVSIFWENERSFDEPNGIGVGDFLGLGVSIPLPSKRFAHGAIQESLAYKQRIELELEGTAFELSNQAELLRKVVERIDAQVRHYQSEIVELVDQNIEDMNTAYKRGQVSLGDVFRTQEQRLEIQSTHLAQLRDYHKSLIEWRSATAYYESSYSYADAE